MAGDKVRLTWGQIGIIITVLMAGIAGWVEVSVKVGRQEERSIRIEEKIDRLRLEVDQAQQNNNFIHQQQDERIRTLERRR